MRGALPFNKFKTARLLLPQVENRNAVKYVRGLRENEILLPSKLIFSLHNNGTSRSGEKKAINKMARPETISRCRRVAVIIIPFFPA